MFRPYMWAIFRLRSNFSGHAIQECGAFFGYWGLGGGGEGGRDVVVPSPHPNPSTQKHPTCLYSGP